MPLLAEAGATERLACVTVAGNTTMLHLLAGVDPTPMGTVPFTPAFLDHRVIRLPDLGAADVHLLPGMSAYVGADLCAGALASGLAYDDGPSLLVDIGTNGEIILKHNGLLHGCATAAGPAFEGAGLTSGMRASPGAIERIRFDCEPFAVHTKIIGRRKAIGICGSGYIDLLAEGRRIGLLNEHGRCLPHWTGCGWRTKCSSPRWTSRSCCRQKRRLRPASLRYCIASGWSHRRSRCSIWLEGSECIST